MLRFLALGALCICAFSYCSFSDVNGARASSKVATPVPLNSSVLIFNRWDFSRCAQQVDEAAKLGNQKINIVPTLHYITTADSHVNAYCFRSSSGCDPFTPALIQQITDDLSVCFARAVQNQMAISILPHLDWWSGTEAWRNFVIFDPLVKYGPPGGDWSYWDILIEPITLALKKTVPVTVPIEFAMQGEMGATVFSYPSSYVQMQSMIKQELQGYTLKTGISLNFNKVNGGVKLKKKKSAAHQALFDASDFIGLSAYNAVTVPPRKEDFVKSVDFFIAQLKLLKIDVPTKKEIHFSEMGIGGGTSANDGVTPAATPKEAAICPWSGIRAAYSIARDPWLVPDNQKLRLNYHQALIEFLKLQPAKWKVTSAFLWNVGSWDPQGLYSGSPYKDPTIVDEIKAYNVGAPGP